MGHLRNVNLVLSDSHRLHQDHLAAHCVENPDAVSGRPGQSPSAPSSRERADEHAGVRGVGLHPDAVAEYGATREGAGRVDAENPHRSTLGTKSSDEAVGEGRLPRPRAPGDANHVCPSGVWEKRLESGTAEGCPSSTCRISREAARTSPASTRGASAVTLPPTSRAVLPRRPECQAPPRRPRTHRGMRPVRIAQPTPCPQVQRGVLGTFGRRHG